MAALSGYAFYATDTASLMNALQTSMNIISNSSVSFSTASVAASKTTAENFLYDASFDPLNNDPVWRGHLTKYSLNSDGAVGNAVWDAGSVLQSADPTTRNILTYVPYYGGIGSFTNLPPGQAVNYLGLTSGSDPTPIIQYIEGVVAYNPDNWKLGDIFHSNPITIESPSPYFNDARDAIFNVINK